MDESVSSDELVFSGRLVSSGEGVSPDELIPLCEQEKNRTETIVSSILTIQDVFFKGCSLIYTQIF
jgi:hypothetical protein